MLGNKIIKKYLRERLVTNSYSRPIDERELVLKAVEDITNNYYKNEVFDIQKLVIDTRYGKYCNSIVEAQRNVIVLLVTSYKITIWYDLAMMRLFINVKTFEESYTKSFACVRLILDIDTAYLEKKKKETNMDLSPINTKVLQELYAEYGVTK